MRKGTICIAVFAAIFVGATGVVKAQSEGSSGSKTLASTMNVYVFPTEGQDATQQSMDEAACFGWAVENTGTDPFELSKQAQQQQQEAEAAMQQAGQAGSGAGAQGAVAGAAGGALIGAIAGDTGKGAAIGATTGLIAGRSRGRQAKAQAASETEKQAAQQQAATAEQMSNFKKAFSVCLEAAKYMVKF